MSKKRICLDPGHFGSKYNPGAVRGYYESAIVWKLTMMEKEILESMGIDVVLTRTTIDSNPELTARGKKAKGCDLFVSNHTNACSTPSVDKIVVIHFTDRKETAIDEKSKAFANKVAIAVRDVMGVDDYSINSRLSGVDRDGNGKVDDNYYGVLHGAFVAGVPGVLIEHSFHTNVSACNWLMNDANLRKLAEACAKCMAEYVGVTATVKNDESSVVYRVQTGAYKKKENADTQLAKVKAAGFKPILVKVGEYYKVQVGAYKLRANADKMAKKLDAAGFLTIVTTRSGEAVTTSTKKSNEQIAQEVIDGKWGNGNDRKTRLTNAGYNYSTIQKLVNKLLAK